MLCKSVPLLYLVCKSVLKHLFFSTSVSLHILSHVPVACEEIGHTFYYLGRPYAQTLLLWKTNPTVEVWEIHRQAEKLHLSSQSLKRESRVLNDRTDSL